MPTLGVNVKVTLSTSDTRTNVVDFYRGLTAGDVQMLPFSYLEPNQERSYDLENVSVILFIGDVYDKSNPFILSLVSHNIIPSNKEDDENEGDGSQDYVDDDGNQFVSDDMWDIAHGNSIPGSKVDSQEDFANLIRVGNSGVSTLNLEEPYDPENDPEDLENNEDEGEGNKEEENKPSSIPSTSLTPATPSRSSIPSIPLIPATGDRPSVPATSLTPAYPRYKEVILDGTNFLLVNAANFKEFKVKSSAKCKVGYKLLLG